MSATAQDWADVDRQRRREQAIADAIGEALETSRLRPCRRGPDPSHGWATPSTYGFLAAGVALGVLFAAWRPTRCSRPAWCSTYRRLEYGTPTAILPRRP
jgi:hypothetical protein